LDAAVAVTRKKQFQAKSTAWRRGSFLPNSCGRVFSGARKQKASTWGAMQPIKISIFSFRILATHIHHPGGTDIHSSGAPYSAPERQSCRIFSFCPFSIRLSRK